MLWIEKYVQIENLIDWKIEKYVQVETEIFNWKICASWNWNIQLKNMCKYLQNRIIKSL